MSAFVVEDKTINRVIGWLNNAEQEHGKFPLILILKAAEICPANPSLPAIPEDWRERLGVSMFTMNTDAVRARYADADESHMIPSSYEWSWELPTDIQALKSLQCWVYQCSEGNVPDRPLYGAFRELERIIACAIVNRLPAYEMAAWA